MAAAQRVPLALLTALSGGLALGYLTSQYRDTLLAHGAAASLAFVVAAAVGVLAYRAYRQLGRARTRVDAILSDELSRRRPSPRPRR